MSSNHGGVNLGPGEGRTIKVPGHAITYKATGPDTQGGYFLRGPWHPAAWGFSEWASARICSGNGLLPLRMQSISGSGSMPCEKGMLAVTGSRWRSYFEIFSK